jgi:hypothetical protein
MKTVLDTLSYMNLGMMIALFFIVTQRQLRRTYRYFTASIGIQVISCSIYPLARVCASITGSPQPWYRYYFYSYWTLYILLAIAMMLAMREIFRHLITPLVNLDKFARLAFRWTAFVAAIIALSLAPQVTNNGPLILRAVQEMMRTVSILQLCMLGFIVLCTQTIGLSLRSRIFGFSLGFGIWAASDFMTAALTFSYPNMNNWISVGSQVCSIASSCIWINYALHPEPARKPLVLPIGSTLLRWNSIASALGHTASNVSLEPAHSMTFMGNVEGIVDRVMARNAVVPPRNL